MDTIRTARAPKQGVESKYRWVILIVVLLAQTGGTWPGQAVAIFGPFMQVDLGLTRAELGLLQTAIAIGQLAFVALAGLITDRLGVRAMLFAGTALVGVFTLVAGVGGSFVLVLAVFTLVGAGSAIVNPATAKAVMDWFPASIRATAMGVKQTGVPLSGVLAGLVMPGIALAFGWRGLVAGLGLTIIAIAIVNHLLYRESTDHGAGKQVKGQASFASALSLLKRRDVLLVSCVAAPMAAVQFAVVTYTVLYLKEDLQYSIVLGGFILALVQFAGMGGRILWGFASDYWFRGNRLATMLCIVSLSAISMAAMAALPREAPVWLVCSVAAATGVSGVSWNGVWMTQVTELVGRELTGSVSGVAIMIGTLGILLGPPVFGTIVDNTGSYRVGWFLMAALCAVSVLLLLALRSSRTRDSGASG